MKKKSFYLTNGGKKEEKVLDLDSRVASSKNKSDQIL
jgi:hypothetical protein